MPLEKGGCDDSFLRPNSVLCSTPCRRGYRDDHQSPGYAADDGSTAFSPEANAYFFEAFDPLPTIGITTSFGFYRVADPIGTKITVFDAADQAAPDQIAWANFPFGGVFDVDAMVGQSLFTLGFGPVGFFLQLDVGGARYDFFRSSTERGIGPNGQHLATPGAYMLGVETGGMVVAAS